MVSLSPPHRTRIKFCGITRLADARAAVAAGADALGFVLTPESRRCMGLEAAFGIRSRLPPFVSAVALFANPDPAFVREAVAALRPDFLQFHGEEPEGFCAGFGVPYLKAVAMGDFQHSLEAVVKTYATAAALLLDGHDAGALGGQGKRFDWSKIGAGVGKPVILAGGLTADNVGEAIRLVHPYAVDVSSGVEKDAKAAPGIKDSGKMAAFAQAVARADAALKM